MCIRDRFITAGFPNKDSTKDLVLEAIKGGADMIEIGIPFSDPQADGPVIQEANEIALNNGITLLEIFEQVKEIREETDVPIALMGYYNPILRMGTKDFIKKCNDAEIDGVILPDLPLFKGSRQRMFLKLFLVFELIKSVISSLL